MTRVLILLCLLVVALGCGGGGDSSNSPFAGSWHATISTGTLSVANDGKFTMSIVDTSSVGGTETYTGSIDNDGHLSGSATNSNRPGVVFAASGTVTKNNDNRLTMTITLTYNGQTASASEAFDRSRSFAANSSKSELGSLFGRAALAR